MRGICAGLILLCVLVVAAAHRDVTDARYVVVDISKANASLLEKIKSRTDLQWWVEAGEELLLLTDSQATKEIATLGLAFRELPIEVHSDRLLTIKLGHAVDLSQINADVLVSAGRSSVIQMREEKIPTFAGHSHAQVRLFEPNVVLSRMFSNEKRNKKRLDPKPEIEAIVNRIDIESWYADMSVLAQHNRFSHGAEIAVVRDWFKEQFSSLANHEVSLMPFRVGSSNLHNVIATRRGSSRPEDMIIVEGHYDSISQDPSRAAPGAEDNASGSAGVLSLARALSGYETAATVVFMVVAGEEQGLYGSHAYVNSLSASDRARIKAVINMDMIAYTRTNDSFTVLLETEEHAAALATKLAEAAQTYTNLQVETSFDAWGSDHVPFLDKNIPAVLTIDRDWDRYPDYHRTGDVVQNTNKNMALGILRMNAATLAELAGVEARFE